MFLGLGVSNKEKADNSGHGIFGGSHVLLLGIILSMTPGR